MTPYVLRAVVAVGHTLPLGLYDSQADRSPPRPSLAVLPLQLQDGHPQVQLEQRCKNGKGLVILYSFPVLFVCLILHSLKSCYNVHIDTFTVQSGSLCTVRPCTIHKSVSRKHNCRYTIK